MRFAFLSRHQPTQEQIDLATERGIELIHLGDVDAFSWSLSDAERIKDMDIDGVICVHPVLALKAFNAGFDVGVFENGNRAPEGEKPQFFAKSLWIQHQPEILMEKFNESFARLASKTKL